MKPPHYLNQGPSPTLKLSLLLPTPDLGNFQRRNLRNWFFSLISQSHMLSCHQVQLHFPYVPTVFWRDWRQKWHWHSYWFLPAIQTDWFRSSSSSVLTLLPTTATTSWRATHLPCLMVSLHYWCSYRAALSWADFCPSHRGRSSASPSSPRMLDSYWPLAARAHSHHQEGYHSRVMKSKPVRSH